MFCSTKLTVWKYRKKGGTEKQFYVYVQREIGATKPLGALLPRGKSQKPQCCVKWKCTKLIHLLCPLWIVQSLSSRENISSTNLHFQEESTWTNCLVTAFLSAFHWTALPRKIRLGKHTLTVFPGKEHLTFAQELIALRCAFLRRQVAATSDSLDHGGRWFTYFSCLAG